MDNASVNSSTMKELSWPYIGCFAHVIHLCVTDGAKLPVIKALTDAFKSVVTFFKHSTIALSRLQKLQEAAGILFYFFKNF